MASIGEIKAAIGGTNSEIAVVIAAAQGCILKTEEIIESVAGWADSAQHDAISTGTSHLSGVKEKLEEAIGLANGTIEQYNIYAAAL